METVLNFLSSSQVLSVGYSGRDAVPGDTAGPGVVGPHHLPLRVLLRDEVSPPVLSNKCDLSQSARLFRLMERAARLKEAG